MSQLMLINPSKRKKQRTPAQKAATRKMIAANRSRAKKPAATARTAKRREINKKQHVAGYYPNPVGIKRVKAVKRRRNPIAARGIAGKAGTMLMPSLQGAGGALLVNTALNYIPFLPAALKSGNGKYLARGLMAVAVGVIGGKIMPQRVASAMAVGAMTVAMHDMLLGMASTAMPTLQLGDVGDYDTGVSEYLPALQGITNEEQDVYSSVGEYVY